MKNATKTVLAILGTILFLASPTFCNDWSIKATYSESCCCAVACPCSFGSAPTLDHCDWNGLIEIEEGQFGDVNLDGIKVVTTARMGEWIKYSVSADATDKQVKAAASLIASAWGTPAKVKVLAVERVAISVKRTEAKISFSTPSSKVEIEIVKGFGGKPIKILNLPKAQHQDMTQYKSITNKHEDEKHGFEYTGTNGLASKLDAHGKL